MGRTDLKVKPFIDKHLTMGYINFKRVSSGNIELYTPRKKHDLDPAYEEIFKAYEKECGRPYKGYSSRDTLKAAIRKSKLYEVNKEESKDQKFVFREKSKTEIENLKKQEKMIKMMKKQNKKRKVMIAMSPDSGYGSEICSYSSPSPHVDAIVSPQNTQQFENDPSNFDIEMEKKTGECFGVNAMKDIFMEIIPCNSNVSTGYQTGEYSENDLQELLRDAMNETCDIFAEYEVDEFSEDNSVDVLFKNTFIPFNEKSDTSIGYQVVENTENDADQSNLYEAQGSLNELQTDESKVSPVNKMSYIPVLLWLPCNTGSLTQSFDLTI